MNILIIEDHYHFVRKLLDALAPQHITGESDLLQITTTSSAEIGLILLKQQWNWILIDHDLPNNWSGWILLNNTKQYRKRDNAKIIAISAVPENNKRLMQHGAHFQATKMDEDFIQCVMNIINNN